MLLSENYDQKIEEKTPLKLHKHKIYLGFLQNASRLLDMMVVMVVFLNIGSRTEF